MQPVQQYMPHSPYTNLKPDHTQIFILTELNKNLKFEATREYGEFAKIGTSTCLSTGYPTYEGTAWSVRNGVLHAIRRHDSLSRLKKNAGYH